MRPYLFVIGLFFSTIVNAGWVQWKNADGGNDHWYSIYESSGSWQDASTYAKNLGFDADLVTITSKSEQDFIQTTF